jgi:hypothetical protein
VAQSYHVSIPTPDLSGVLGILSAVAVMGLSIVALRTPGVARRMALLSLALLLINLVAGVVAVGPPGLRRFTGCVAAFYVLFVVAWRVATDARARQPQATWPKAALALLALLAVHHVAAIPVNLWAFGPLDRPSDGGWFAVKSTPAASLDYWAGEVSRGRVLDCRDVGLGARCRYAEIFAAVAGDAEWNGRGPEAVSAFDMATQRTIWLSRRDWPRGY